MIEIFNTGINIDVKQLNSGMYHYSFINDGGEVINIINDRSHPKDLDIQSKVVKALNKILSNANKIAYAANHNIRVRTKDDFNNIQRLMLEDIKHELSQSVIYPDNDIIKTPYGTVFIKDRCVYKCANWNGFESLVLVYAYPKSVERIDEGIEVCFKNRVGRDTYIKGADEEEVCDKLKEVFGKKYRDTNTNYISMISLLESMLEEE